MQTNRQAWRRTMVLGAELLCSNFNSSQPPHPLARKFWGSLAQADLKAPLLSFWGCSCPGPAPFHLPQSQAWTIPLLSSLTRNKLRNTAIKLLCLQNTISFSFKTQSIPLGGRAYRLYGCRVFKSKIYKTRGRTHEQLQLHPCTSNRMSRSQTLFIACYHAIDMSWLIILGCSVCH